MPDEKYADVILPLPLRKAYTYRVPDSLAGITEGCRVLVPFGRRKVYTALVDKVHNQAPEIYTAKNIIELLDEAPLVTVEQKKLFSWMAEYYMCTEGEIFNAAIPSGLKMTSESRIQLNPEAENTDLSDSEQALVSVLKEKGTLSYTEAARILDIKNIHPVLKSLIDKRKIILFEEVKEKYSPKIEKRLKLAPEYLKQGRLKELFDHVKSGSKQEEAVLRYLDMTKVRSDPSANAAGVPKAELKKYVSASSIQTLVNKGIFEQFEQVISRFPDVEQSEGIKDELSPAQQAARDQILRSFESKGIALLQGITGSGKTEIYIHLIKSAIESGNQVLYLLPEIALTTQIVMRLKKVFGNNIGIYHSRYSDNERVEVYEGVRDGRFQLIIGVRSSIFLPFDNLGLVIVDEEHEATFKQYDPAPRYNARDTSLVLAGIHNARVLLGSATPSVESYYHAQSGRYGYIRLAERFRNAALPTMELVDMKREKRMREVKNNFSSVLLKEIQNALNRDEQVILFQNRRGYAPYLSCEDCGYVVKCLNCDVSMTYHMYSNELRCHYCGYHQQTDALCPACGSTNVRPSGYGTEKIEEDLSLFFSEAGIQRMDQDTTRNKNSFQKIIEDFHNKKTNLLVGTQMVAKGLDFDNVTLVGIFDTDRYLHFPDFRSYERTFQLLSQVSGRAGRKEKPGKVVIQTNDPEHEIIKKVVTNDLEGLYQSELHERKKFNYPPFSRLIKLTVRHADKRKAEKCAESLQNALLSLLGKHRIFGPEPPLIPRIRNKYLMDIMIKLERDRMNLSKVKAGIIFHIDKLKTVSEFKSVDIVIDVDPV